jgi:hypothetical protein
MTKLLRATADILAAKEAAVRLDGESRGPVVAAVVASHGGLKEAKDCRRIILTGSLVATAVALTNHLGVNCVYELPRYDTFRFIASRSRRRRVSYRLA